MASLRAPIFVKTALPTQSSEEFLLRDLPILVDVETIELLVGVLLRVALFEEE